MKKSFLILISFGILVLILIPLLLSFKKLGTTLKSVVTPTTQQQFPTPTSLPISNLSPTIQIALPTAPTLYPTNSLITVGGVQMKDFTKTSTQMNQEGDLSIANVANSYQIVYLAHFQQFLITILGSPFDTQRQAAETAFLQSLGISQADACKLSVSISTPRYVNPDQAGQQYPLSFCL